MTGPLPGGAAPPAAAPSVALRTLVAASSLFLFVAPLASSAGWRVGSLLVGSIALAVAAWRRELGPAVSIPRALFATFAAWLALALASAAWSVDPRLSLSEFQAQGAYVALAFGLFYFATLDLRSWRTSAGALAAGTLAVLVVQVAQDLLPFELMKHRADGGGGPWSTHLVLVAPVLLVLPWPRPWGFAFGARRQLVALCLLLVATWMGDSRMAWVAFAVQLATCALLWRHMPALEPERARVMRRFMVLMAGVLVVACGAMVVERNDRLYANAPLTTHLEHDLRPRIWRTAIELVGEKPLLGHGFGREIRADRFEKHTPPGEHPRILHAHNMFLDQAVQLGLVGAALFVALLAALALAYARLLRDERSAPLALVGLVVLAGFVTKNLTDDFLHRHNALVFWAVNGMLLGLAQRLAARR